jgi:hypothetical protein
MFPAIPNIPPFKVIIYQVGERDQYFVEFHFTDCDPFRLTGLDESRGLRYFTRQEMEKFVNSELPAILKMVGAEILYRRDEEASHD